MLDVRLLRSIATQMMETDEVVIGETRVKVGKTSHQRLRTLAFEMNGHSYQAIEQNADKPSQWGKLARERHRVVQFRDKATGKYVAVAVDGEVKEYGR